MLNQFLQEAQQAKSTLRFIAVNGGQETDAHRVTIAAGADELVARELVRPAITLISQEMGRE